MVCLLWFQLTNLRKDDSRTSQLSLAVSLARPQPQQLFRIVLSLFLFIFLFMCPFSLFLTTCSMVPILCVPRNPLKYESTSIYIVRRYLPLLCLPFWSELVVPSYQIRWIPHNFCQFEGVILDWNRWTSSTSWDRRHVCIFELTLTSLIACLGKSRLII